MTHINNLSTEDLLKLANEIAVSLSQDKTADEINLLFIDLVNFLNSSSVNCSLLFLSVFKNLHLHTVFCLII